MPEPFEIISTEKCLSGEHWLIKHFGVTAILISLIVNGLAEVVIHETETKLIEAALPRSVEAREPSPIQPAIYIIGL